MFGKKKPEVVRIARLTSDVFEALRHQVNGTCLVTSTTTELQAGFQLGIAHVLNAISTGLVIETA